MAVNLPTELLRSFAAIVDAGSMLRATERVFVTQSALSLQMKRLEETVQTPLFHRDGRRLVLTPTGETLLGYTREMLALNDQAVCAVTGDALAGPVRLGLAQDFAEGMLSEALADFVRQNPTIALQVRVGEAHELLEGLMSDRLDLALSIGAAGDPAAVGASPVVWMGAAGLVDQEVLPVAVLERPCPFRETALAALEANGRPYRIVLQTPSLSVLRAAVNSGLGVTPRTASFAARRLGESESERLPALPPVTYVRRLRRDPRGVVVRLGDLLGSAALAARPPSL